MLASGVSNNNNKLSRPLPAALAEAARAAASSSRPHQPPSAARQVRQMENDRRRKIAAKCLELEEMLEARG